MEWTPSIRWFSTCLNTVFYACCFYVIQTPGMFQNTRGKTRLRCHSKRVCRRAAHRDKKLYDLISRAPRPHRTSYREAILQHLCGTLHEQINFNLPSIEPDICASAIVRVQAHAHIPGLHNLAVAF